MTETSDRLSLPLLAAGQAQKEIWHNEALMLLDLLVQPVVQSEGGLAPPPMPALGQCWIIGDNPTGEWAGKPRHLTIWTQSGWRFAAPQTGMTCSNVSDGLMLRFNGTQWIKGEMTAELLRIGGNKVVGVRQPAIANPSGGAIIDTEARLAIISLLVSLRTHGLISA